MQRIILKPGQEVFVDHLNYIEETKIENIRNIVTKFGTAGPIKGLVVSPDTNDATKVSVTAGYGYTYGGEYFELLNDITGITVSNAIGAKTYIAAKIAENEGFLVPDHVSGEVNATMISHEYSIEALSESEWLNLSDKSMYMLLAIVHGSGGLVRATDIQRNSVQPVSIMFVESQPVALTGVEVVAVSTNTPSGVSSLKFDYVNYEFSWKAPSDTSYGSPVSIGADGIYTVYDSTATLFIKINIEVVRLPVQDVEENLNIVDLFADYDLSIGTSNDILHRSMAGSGLLSPRNPHGQTLDDFDPGVNQNLITHRSKEHTASIIGTPGSSTCVPIISSSNTLTVGAIVSGEYVVSGGILISAVYSPLVVFSVGDSVGTYNIYIDSSGRLEKTSSVVGEQYFNVCTVDWDGVQLTNVVDKRKWGTIRPDRVSVEDDENREKELNEVSYSLSDTLSKIRKSLGNILNGSWTKTPATNLDSIDSSINSLNSDMTDAKNDIANLQTDVSVLDGEVTGLQSDVGAISSDVSSLQSDVVNLQEHANKDFNDTGPSDELHGVYMGHGGGINADKIDDWELSDILAGATNLIVFAPEVDMQVNFYSSTPVEVDCSGYVDVNNSVYAYCLVFVQDSDGWERKTYVAPTSGGPWSLVRHSTGAQNSASGRGAGPNTNVFFAPLSNGKFYIKTIGDLFWGGEPKLYLLGHMI